MFRKLLVVASVFFVAMQLLSACCNCEEYPTLRADWSGVGLTHGSYSVDSGYVHARQDTGLDFSGRHLVLFVEPRYELLAARFNGLHALGNRAYACKCDDMRYFNMQRRISAVSVRTLSRFDVGHPAGSDVKACFKQIGRDGKSLQSDSLWLPANPFPEGWFGRLFLDGRPEAGTAQQFEVALSLDDGTAFYDTSAVFRF